MNFLAPLLRAPGHPHVLRHVGTQELLATTIEPAFDSARRRRGLLGRDGLDRGTAIILAPCGGIHTFFMRFALDVIFVNREGTVVKVCPGLKPWRIAAAWGAFAAIELQAGASALGGVRRGDSVVVEPAPGTRSESAV